MKKFYIILILLLMFLLTGCGSKFDLYQGSQDIKITRKSDSGTARINISDTYSSLYIKKYQDNRFNKTDYTVSSESDSKYFTGRATERVNITHYSFMGEHDFTDDEVNHYCKVMDKISNNILSGIYQKN